MLQKVNVHLMPSWKHERIVWIESENHFHFTGLGAVVEHDPGQTLCNTPSTREKNALYFWAHALISVLLVF